MAQAAWRGRGGISLALLNLTMPVGGVRMLGFHGGEDGLCALVHAATGIQRAHGES